jgi:hypothetical protein
MEQRSADALRSASLAPTRRAPKPIKGPAILSLWPAKDAAPILALFDVAWPVSGQPLTVRRCRLIELEGGALTFTGPCESWEHPKEGRKYRVLAVFPHNWHERIKALALEAWEKYRECGELPQDAPDSMPSPASETKRGGRRR